MPRSYYYDEPEEFPPPPSTPPPPEGGGGGRVGTNLPEGNPGQPQPPQPPVTPRANTNDGGGGGGGAFVLPGIPNIQIPGAPVFTPPVWNAPTYEAAMKEPGYQFRLGSGQQAMERSAAARGRLRTGGTLADLLEYGQNFGAQEYGNVYNRALAAYGNEYKAAYDAFAPLFAQWQMKAGGGKEAQLAAYQAQLQNALIQATPRGGGGGYEPTPEEILGPEPRAPYNFDSGPREPDYYEREREYYY